MTADALLVVKFLFTSIWRIATSWHIPGTHTTPAAFFLFFFSVAIVINFIRRLFGLSGEIASSNRRVSSAESRANRLSKNE